MYGITWATSDHTYAHSAYGIEHLDDAYNMAFIGPHWTLGNGIGVDFMCSCPDGHSRATETYARIEKEEGYIVSELAPGERPPHLNEDDITVSRRPT